MAVIPKAVVQGFYAAFTEEDFQAHVAAYLTEDVVWHVAGHNPLAGTFTGVPAVLEAMRAYGEASHHTLRLDTMTLLADAHHVVAVHDATATTAEVDYHTHEVDVFHLRGQQIAEFWSFSEDQSATDRLWSSGS